MALTGADIIPQATPNPRRRTSRYSPPRSRTKVAWLASWCDGRDDHPADVDHPAPRLDHQRARLLRGQRAGWEHEATGADRRRSVPAEDVDRGGVERVVLAPAVQLVGAGPPPADDGVVAQAVGQVALVVALGDREAQWSRRHHPRHEAIEGRGAGIVLPGSRPTRRSLDSDRPTGPAVDPVEREGCGWTWRR